MIPVSSEEQSQILDGIECVVCDMDNTLYDWVGFFVPSFYAMVEEIERISGIDRELILNDFRDVHRRYHDTEHPFSLLEVECIRRKYSGWSDSKILEAFDPALYAFNKTRKQLLTLYPRVPSTLRALKSRGIRLVAHSEAKYFSIVDRLARFELYRYFESVYCRERSDKRNEHLASGRYVLPPEYQNNIVELEHHQRKPAPTVLEDICGSVGVAASQTLYVGDSLSKDMLMAQDAGVRSAWAKYGLGHSSAAYSKLVRVSHWAESEVKFEQELTRRAKSVQPDAVLNQGFWEVLSVLGISAKEPSIRDAVRIDQGRNE